MSEECTHDCSSCGADCPSRNAPQHEPPHAKSHIKKVIGVVSGKGGVGKSMTSAMLAVAMRRMGHSAGILAADITGPSIPKLFGVHGPATGFLFVDMPPGTGDVPLTVFQTLPVDGIVIVSSPQELVGMIVGKAVQMAEMMKVPVLGIIENMSYAVCPHCGEHIQVFGDSHVEQTAEKYHLPVLAKMPIDPELAKEADGGMIETYAGDFLDNAAKTVAALLV